MGAPVAVGACVAVGSGLGTKVGVCDGCRVGIKVRVGAGVTCNYILLFLQKTRE